MLIVLTLFTTSSYAADFNYDAGDIEGDKTSSGITYTLNVSKGNLNTSYDFDSTNGVTSGGPTGIDISVSSGGATGVVTYALDSIPTSNFTISMNGKLIPPSGGDGSQPTWSASGNAKAPFYIKSNQNNGAKEITVPAGTSVTYTAYEGDSSKTSNWTVTPIGWSSQSKTNASSITFNRSFWGNIATWFTSDQSVTTPVPGSYYISARPTDDASKSDTGVMTVVGVQQLSTTYGNVTVSSTVETPGENESVVIDAPNSSLGIAHGTLTFTATPEPGTVWPNNYPIWKVNGTQVQTGGTTYEFSSSGKIVGKYTVIAESGNKAAIDVYVASCYITVTVDEPIRGSGAAMDAFSETNATYSIGHATVQVTVNPAASLEFFPFSELDVSKIKGSVGLNPNSRGNVIMNGFSDGKIENPDTATPDTTKTYRISIAGALSAFGVVLDDLTQPPRYYLATYLHYDAPIPYLMSNITSYNCSSYPQTVGSVCDAPIPSASGEWYGNIAGFMMDFEGDSPGFLGPRIH